MQNIARLFYSNIPYIQGNTISNCTINCKNTLYIIIYIKTTNEDAEFMIYVTEYGTALTTILPILFLYLNTVTVTAGTFEP